jgi:hypothetical protein
LSATSYFAETVEPGWRRWALSASTSERYEVDTPAFVVTVQVVAAPFAFDPQLHAMVVSFYSS